MTECTQDAMLVAFAFCCFAWRQDGRPICCDMKRVPGHPWARYKIERDCAGGSWVICRCDRCGAEWRRGCTQQKRVSRWVFRFAVLHGHGYHPVLK